MTEPKERIGNPCPDCGGCNTYCADCTDPILDHLSVLETAATEVRDALLRTCGEAPADRLWRRCLAAKLDDALETGERTNAESS